MAEKRRLPVLQEARTPDSSPEEPPPWHWVPLGALVILLAGTIAARIFYVPFAQRQIDRLYGGARTAAEYAQIDRHIGESARHALAWRLFAGALPVALFAVVLGGFVVGRFGKRTSARHGTLAGLSAMVLLVFFAGRNAVTFGELVAYLALVPFGGAVGYLGARVGVALRDPRVR